MVERGLHFLPCPLIYSEKAGKVTFKSIAMLLFKTVLTEFAWQIGDYKKSPQRFIKLRLQLSAINGSFTADFTVGSNSLA